MNNKTSFAQLQKAIDLAMQALEKLEEAMNEGDQRKIGARLYELRRALVEASREAH